MLDVVLIVSIVALLVWFLVEGVPEDDGLSQSTRILIIVVCTLAGVAVLVLVIVVLVVSHTRNMYKTMAKRHASRSSLQSTGQKMVRSISATSENMGFLRTSQPPDSLDNRRNTRRNSRMERRTRKYSSDSVARARANEFQVTAAAGDISFGPGARLVEESAEDLDVFEDEQFAREPKPSINSTNAGQFNTDSVRAGLMSGGDIPSTDYAAIGPRGGLV